MRLSDAEPRQRARLGPEQERAIREAALRIAGGAGAWDGTTRLEAGPARWSDVPDALAAAGRREDVQVIVAEVLADGTGDAWAFELRTSERAPGRFRVERTPAEPGYRVTRVELGRRPEARAMRLRAGRLAEAFAEEMDLIAARLRFVEATGD